MTVNILLHTYLYVRGQIRKLLLKIYLFFIEYEDVQECQINNKIKDITTNINLEIFYNKFLPQNKQYNNYSDLNKIRYGFIKKNQIYYSQYKKENILNYNHKIINCKIINLTIDNVSIKKNLIHYNNICDLSFYLLFEKIQYNKDSILKGKLINKGKIISFEHKLEDYLNKPIYYLYST